MLLTPSPVSIVGNYVLELENPISTVTKGASIELDITNFISKSDFKDAGIVGNRGTV